MINYNSWEEKYVWGNLTTIQMENCIGTCNVEYSDEFPKWGYIYGLTVNPKHRRNNAGTELIKIAEQDIIKHKLYRARLKVEKKKEWLVEWYKKLGYKIIEEDEDYNYDDEDYYLMEKSLMIYIEYN